jgi:hypothetical protein
MGRPHRRTATACVYSGVQQHAHREGHLRVAGGGQSAGRHPPAKIDALRNTPDRKFTIRVDTKVGQESDTDQVKSDEVAWMSLTLDTVGKLEWPRDRQQRPIYPEGFEALAKKRGRPLHPPGA